MPKPDSRIRDRERCAISRLPGRDFRRQGRRRVGAEGLPARDEGQGREIWQSGHRSLRLWFTQTRVAPVPLQSVPARTPRLIQGQLNLLALELSVLVGSVRLVHDLSGALVAFGRTYASAGAITSSPSSPSANQTPGKGGGRYGPKYVIGEIAIRRSGRSLEGTTQYVRPRGPCNRNRMRRSGWRAVVGSIHAPARELSTGS